MLSFVAQEMAFLTEKKKDGIIFLFPPLTKIFSTCSEPPIRGSFNELQISVSKDGTISCKHQFLYIQSNLFIPTFDITTKFITTTI